MTTILFSFIFNFLIGFLIGSSIGFVLFYFFNDYFYLLKHNWRVPMNGFQDWLKLNDSYYIKDTILIENKLGGVDEIWHNDIWFTEDGYSLTTKQLYAEYLRYAKNNPRFSKHFQ
jgi:hypothetical protein